MRSSHLCPLILIVLCGVFGVDSDEVKSVSVTEGDSVTLNTDVTEIQRKDQILWMFGPQKTRIAEIYRKITYLDDSYEMFGDRLKMDNQTGSLTIRNITTEHTGLFQLHILSSRKNSYMSFTVAVYAPLPTPVVTSNSSNCSSSSSSDRSSLSNCSLVCSVVNVSHVTLSWLKGNSLLSSISVSDLSISLSLPLEVEDQENSSYSCEINNTITHQTTQLDISALCHTCPDSIQGCGPTEAVIRLVVSALVAIAAVVLVVYDVTSERVQQDRT